MFAPDEDVVWEVVAAVILEERSVQGDSQISVLTSRVYSWGNVELMPDTHRRWTVNNWMLETYEQTNKYLNKV